MVRFSAVNKSTSIGYNANMQRHHLLPLQAKSLPELKSTITVLRRSGSFRFDDWRANGILLPCDEYEALKTGWPLHRGPHPRYNQLVLDRMIRISNLAEKFNDKNIRLEFLEMRISLLQSALRQGLLNSGIGSLTLSRKDPAHYPVGYFDHLDDCVDRLYSQTGQSVSSD